MSYVLVPIGEGVQTRLLKIVLRMGDPPPPLFSIRDLIMARRQLLNLASLAGAP